MNVTVQTKAELLRLIPLPVISLRRNSTNELVKTRKELSLRHNLIFRIVPQAFCLEGNSFTHDQTRYIYETNTIDMENGKFNVKERI